VLASFGLLTSSAVLVHLSGGLTETHFHFFVMIGLIALYQDWLPFLMAIAFVAVHHAVFGVLFPHEVYGDSAARSNPWVWAGIHALFVLAASAAQLTSWRVVEDEHARSNDALAARERRFRALIEHASDAVSVMDASGVIIYESQSVEAVLGYEPGERLGRSVFDFVAPDEQARARAVVAELVGEGAASHQLELRSRHRDGRFIWVDTHVTNLLDDPDVGGIVANFRDVGDRKALEARLAHQAFHDPLTGLANRALFLDRIGHAVSSQHRFHDSCLAVLFLDLDDFKTINDGLGHEVGDLVLAKVAERLVGCLREQDTCARLGGDEFAILLERLDEPDGAYDVGLRVLEAINDPLVLQGHEFSLNASLGIVISTGDEDPAALIRNADLAMYKAKGGGKGRFEIFERGMYEAVIERLKTKADIRRGIDSNEFVVFYQPIVDLATGRILAAEALVRWDHPQRGIVSPAEFLPLAEDTGYIVPMGRQVLRQACRDAATWKLGDGSLPAVSVNLSARQLQDPAVIVDVTEALAESGLPADRLILEITESALITDPDATAIILHKLKALGVSVALDDFGTGYSSLNYLRRFPVDALKIDKSFVDALSDPKGQTDASLVAAITRLGEALDLHITAEGVEHPAQVEELLKLGCRQGQGYHFARPVAASDFAVLVRNNPVPRALRAVPA
jgi:diguanylate cyclase (GGDEF)-like protein/PAS domain S-box-containing protein